VILAVDSPQLLELQVSERREINGEPARTDAYQARIGGLSLPIRLVTREAEGVKVVFDVPSELWNKQEFLFLCFSSGYDAEDRDSERFLYSVRWH
jgi:hypothetical protein